MRLSDVTFFMSLPLSPALCGIPACSALVIADLAERAAGVAADILRGRLRDVRRNMAESACSTNISASTELRGARLSGPPSSSTCASSSASLSFASPAFRIAGDADDAAAVVLHGEHRGLELHRLAGVGDGKTTSAFLQLAAGAVHRLRAVEEVGRCAGGREERGSVPCHMAGLSRCRSHGRGVPRRGIPQ